jgi:hypothetical protein
MERVSNAKQQLPADGYNMFYIIVAPEEIV